MSVSSRPWRTAFASLSVAALLGLASNSLSSEYCVAETQSIVRSTLETERARFAGYASHRDLVARPISWAEAGDLRDEEAPAGSRPWLLPPHLVPSSTSGVSVPWGYSVRLPWFVPFVVRVAYGYDFDGQAGAIGVRYYLSFFGRGECLRDRVLGMF